MPSDSEENNPEPCEERQVHVWETADFSSPNAFRQYREYMAESHLPMSLEYRSDEPFRARFDATAIGPGLMAKIRSSPHTSVRTRSQSSNHGIDGFHIVHYRCGSAAIEHADQVVVARQGDTVILDGRIPFKSTWTEHLTEGIGICVPRSAIETYGIGAEFSAFGVLKCRTPIANCLELLAKRVGRAPLNELEALYAATLSLATVEMHQHNSVEVAAADCFILRQILLQIDRDLGERELSVQYIADKFNISVRYVHKLFASKGTTCAAYILQKRLDHVHHDLIARPRESISSLALRWGFNEVGHFNRGFKKRFGRTPSRFRRA